MRFIPIEQSEVIAETKREVPSSGNHAGLGALGEWASLRGVQTCDSQVNALLDLSRTVQRLPSSLFLAPPHARFQRKPPTSRTILIEINAIAAGNDNDSENSNPIAQNITTN